MYPLFVLIFLSVSRPIWCEFRRENEQKILDRILSPERYDARLRPPGLNGSDDTTTVRVNMFVRSLSAVDDQKMQYDVQLTFRQQWQDERLRYDGENGRIRFLTLTGVKRIWEPDLFFSNENEGHFHDMMMPNRYYRIAPDGTVLYSRRLSLTLGCPMDLKRYPFDRQSCTLRMASYGYSSDEVIFQWKNDQAVQVVRNLHLAKFSLEKFTLDYCDTRTSTGNYSCLKVDFLLKRVFFFYLIQIYLPTAMMVLLSFTSFWFEPAAVQARTFLGVVTLLSLVLYTSIINASIPQVSYTKSIDIWTGCCITFAFAAFLEFATVNYVKRSKDKAKKDEEDNVPNNDEFGMKPLILHGGNQSNGKCAMKKYLERARCCGMLFKRRQATPESIDVLSRIMFPVIFFVFSLSYYLTYACMPYDN